MSPRHRTPLPTSAHESVTALASTLALVRGALVSLPMGQGLVLLDSWRSLLEQSPVPGARRLAQDLTDLAGLLHAGPMDEVPFQLALISAQLHHMLLHIPGDAQPELLELADHLARLAQAGAGRHPTVRP